MKGSKNVIRNLTDDGEEPYSIIASVRFPSSHPSNSSRTHYTHAHVQQSPTEPTRSKKTHLTTEKKRAYAQKKISPLHAVHVCVYTYTRAKFT